MDLKWQGFVRLDTLLLFGSLFFSKFFAKFVEHSFFGRECFWEQLLSKKWLRSSFLGSMLVFGGGGGSWEMVVYHFHPFKTGWLSDSGLNSLTLSTC